MWEQRCTTPQHTILIEERNDKVNANELLAHVAKRAERAQLLVHIIIIVNIKICYAQGMKYNINIVDISCMVISSKYPSK